MYYFQLLTLGSQIGFGSGPGCVRCWPSRAVLHGDRLRSPVINGPLKQFSQRRSYQAAHLSLVITNCCGHTHTYTHIHMHTEIFIYIYELLLFSYTQVRLIAGDEPPNPCPDPVHQLAPAWRSALLVRIASSPSPSKFSSPSPSTPPSARQQLGSSSEHIWSANNNL